MFYFKKKPKWLQWFYGDCVWEMDKKQKVLYLTFDDGPHPTETEFVLDQLKKYDAKATFFCIGENVDNYHDIYLKILADGHATGNHTYTHLDGWKTNRAVYFDDIANASTIIQTNLFRPPYGHIKSASVKKIQKMFGLKTVLWSLLSGDFDNRTSGEKCFRNVADHADNGAIIVFHDSTLASKNLRYALPKVLEYFTKKGYAFKSINLT